MSDTTHYAIAKRVAKRIAAANNSCFLRQLDERSTDRAQRTEDRLRSLRTEGSHCKPLHLAKRLLIAPADAKRIADIHKQRAALFLSTNLYRDGANKRVDDEYCCANHLERTPSPLSLSLSRISYDQESFSIRIDNQFGWRRVASFRLAKVFHTVKVSPVATILTQNPLVRLTNRFFPRRSLDNYPC